MDGSGAGAEAAALCLNPKHTMVLQQAVADLGDGKHSKAADGLSGLLGEGAALYGEHSVVIAPVYFNYGVALLRQAEASSNIFGSAVEDAQHQAAVEVAEEAAAEGDEADVGAGAAAGEEKPSAEAAASAAADKLAKSDAAAHVEGDGAEDREELLEISWEVLELARGIYENAGDSNSTKKALADVLSCLGDHCVESDNFKGAADEFSKCLKLRTELCSQTDKSLADAHHMLALSLEMSANQPEEPDAAKFRADAVKHFSAARNVMLLRLKSVAGAVDGLKDFVAQLATLEGKDVDKENGATNADKAPATDKEAPSTVPMWAAAPKDGVPEHASAQIKELTDIIDNLSAKVVDAGVDTAAELAPLAAAAAATTPTTTVGFGAGAATPSGPVNVLSVKRKPTAAPEASKEDEAAAESPSKRVRTAE